MDDALQLDLSQLSAALRAGQLTSAALVAAAIARIRRLDPKLNIFVALDEAGALAACADSDVRLRAGQPRSPLEGIPLSIKDSLHVAGQPATWGSRAFAGFVPEQDELPVARLRAAGAVLLGKTNVPELTVEGYTRNELFGATRNPWNPALTPGGSSGGAAASVAARFVPAAIGTDGGGSIRRPACHCGLVGFKPSTGRIARLGGFPVILHDFEVIGTLARSVADTVLLDRVLAGPDPRDRRSLLAAAPPPAAHPLRILFVPAFGTAPVDPEVAAATAALARDLQAAGHAVRQADVFFDLDAAARIWHVVSRTGVAWVAAAHAGKLAASAAAMAADGARLTAVDYAAALDQAAVLRRQIADLFATTDFVLTPTAAALPWPAEQPYPTEIDGRPAGPRDHAIFTGWANLAGVPAISLPVGLSRAGLPIGVQLAAPFGADAALLAFAAEVAARHPAPALPEL